jgi:hypothetical protein
MSTQQRRTDRLSRLEQAVNLSWWLVPLAMGLLAVAAALSWPELSARPDATATQAGQPALQTRPAPVTGAVTGASAAYAAAPQEETQEDNHAPTF